MDIKKKGKRGLVRVVFGRTLVIILLLLIQFLVLYGSVRYLSRYQFYVNVAFNLLSVCVVVVIVNEERVNPMFKMAWLIPVIAFPVFGTFLYLFIRLNPGARMLGKRHKQLIKETQDYLVQDEETLKELEEEDRSVACTAKYLMNTVKYPVYKNSNVQHFACGEDKFRELKFRLENAKKFIFLEYFILEDGFMWDTLLEILERKVKEGVEVRLMYDGTCSFNLLPYSYPKKMQEKGIKCKIFSPIKPLLSTHQNNRDHRKILVIDGEVAFTGGINLADEYINRKVRFGYWKDTAVMISGEAVRSFTVMFLQMWNIDETKKEDYTKFFTEKKCESDGYIIPYGDSPLDKENTGEEVYLDIISQATEYIHIMTPYLILDNEMVSALTHAAKSGIETIIIMPHIPDKKYAFYLAKTYYEELMLAGVKIYEFTPGFVHAKEFIADGKKAVVGTINLDFRSLYLHFECAAYMYNNSEIRKIEADFQETMAKSQLVTISDLRKMPFYEKVFGMVLRLIAPMM